MLGALLHCLAPHASLIHAGRQLDCVLRQLLYTPSMDEDAKVCYCFHVSRRKLLNFIRLNRPRVPSQLSECGGAGTGCGWCIPFLKQLHQQAVAGGETDLERLTPREYELLRAAYIRAGKGTPPTGATPLPADEKA
jgi:NAD(P)H-nitrite reductase large subunit